jgi:hypothetical protein
MRVFISYSRKDRIIAHRIRGSLAAAGYETFLDTRDLPPGEEFHSKIRDALGRSDYFIFLVSEHSTNAGSYAMTELSFAEATWPNPSGIVLPVLLNESVRLPAYLSSIGAVVPQGAVEAEVLALIERLSIEKNALPHSLTQLQLQLRRWSRQAPSPEPLTLKRTSIPRSYKYRMWLMYATTAILCLGMIIGAIYGFNYILRESGYRISVAFLSSLVAVLGMSPFIYILTWLFRLQLNYYNIYIAIRKIGVLNPVPAMIVEKALVSPFTTEVAVETTDGLRITGLRPISEAARCCVEEDIGWVYIHGDRILHAIPAIRQDYSHRSPKFAVDRFLDKLLYPIYIVHDAILYVLGLPKRLTSRKRPADQPG